MFRTASFLASAALAALSAAPVAALDLPAPAPTTAQAVQPVATGDTGTAEGWRRYRGHRRGGIDAGDVIAGVLVLGSIAAIASAASKDRDRAPARAGYPADGRRADRRGDVRYNARGAGERSRGLDRAVEMCVGEVERGRERVDSVDDARRSVDGWHVAGVLDDGTRWTCQIDNDGRIRDLDFGKGDTPPGVSYRSAADGQLDPEIYARARARVEAANQRALPSPAGSETSEPYEDYDSDLRPAYPGGPLPGEDGYEEALQAVSR